ncbi:MAG TPA: TonB-dependent siderophore receptor [Usitatibacter sp.]|nr:TonB-dependent siderophore receptor [Usitatibacter sp.]
MSRSLRAASFAFLCVSTSAHSQDASDKSKDANAVPMPRLEVTEQRPGPQGSQEEGYRVGSINSLGPLGTYPILDTPYSVSVLPRELMENSQAKNFKEVSKYLPLVAYQEQQGPQILRPQTRGLQGGNFQNSRADGMTMFITVANAMEQFEQIEVVNGVSASLYGPANPSGMFNFVSKRPTPRSFARLNLGYDSDSIFTAHADFGGPIGDSGVAAYRVNVLGADGTGYVDGSKLKRRLGDLAVDLHPSRDTTVEMTVSDYYLYQHGYPGWFTYGEAIVLPKAPDPTRVGYGQSYAGVEMSTQMGIVKLRHDFGSNWHLVFGVLGQDATRDINTPVNNLRNNAGTYISSFGAGFAPRFTVESDMGYLNGQLVTGGVSHDLTIGTAGYRASTYSVRTPASAASLLLGTASIDSPQVFPEPANGPPYVRDNFNSSINYQQGFNVSDTMKFSEAWLARVGVSEDWFHTVNYNVSGAVLPGYNNNGASPTASLIFKPRTDMTTYVTYASSLQAGDTAPGTAANAGQSLAPYRSKEIEAGFKMTLRDLDFYAALFRIDRPFANTDTADNVFKIMGTQVNKGLELSLVGHIVPSLVVYGGFTVLNAKLDDTGNAATNGKDFVGQPKYKGNVLFEYSPPALAGFTAIADWFYSSQRAGNDTNSFYSPGYNVFDVGARYATRIAGSQTLWRLTVNNVGDERYWSTIAPSNLTGTNTGNLVAHLGAPRTISASVSIDF